MALLFLSGFDIFGAANSNSAVVISMLTAGEWNSTTGSANIVAPLSSAGQAISVIANSSLVKTLAASYARLIGGMRFSSPLVSSAGIQFLDGASNQCGILLNTAGTIAVRNGSFSTGTVLGTSTATITANSTHYLEFDISFGNSANYQLWLDGVSILSGTGDTTTTANNTASGFSLITSGASSALVVDDLYVFDTTGSANNAVLLTSPRIETQFPAGDGTVQFTAGAAILGTSVSRGGSNQSTAANQFRVRPFTPAANMTLSSISFLPSATNASVQLRPVVYTDSAGAPSSLMSAGSTSTGTTSGTVKTLALTTPQALTAGTQYWLGFMCDILVATSLTGLDATTTDRIATSTFASGAPGTAPATSAAAATLIWGNVTSTGVNWYEVSQNPAQGAQSYLFDATTGHEDLYTFASLATNPSTVHAVAVKANCSRSDSGARTVSMRMLSGGTDSGGSATGQTPGTSYGWLTSLFATDPNTSAAWLPANVNAAQVGFKIDT